MPIFNDGHSAVCKGTCLFLRWTFRCVYTTITCYIITININIYWFSLTTIPLRHVSILFWLPPGQYLTWTKITIANIPHIIVTITWIGIWHLFSGPGNSATDYGLNGPGSNPDWGRDFPLVHTGPGAHPASCKMGTGSLPGVKCDRGMLLTTHPLLMPQSWKSRAIPLPTIWATPGL